MPCDVRRFDVIAPKGSWITVKVSEGADLFDVATADGVPVADGGTSYTTDETPGDPTPQTVTFRQLASHSAYQLEATSVSPAVVVTPSTYSAVVSLTGADWDLAHNCGQTEPEVLPPIPANLSPPLRLAVRLVTAPKDLAEVRRLSKGIVDFYARINIKVILSFDTITTLPTSPNTTWDLLGPLKRHYHGERPPGVDVVYLATDLFTGGYTDCIGGIRWPERAFALGQIHFTEQGVAIPNQVKMSNIAAHELGHLLGAQHWFANCAQAEPAAASQGEPGPCTVMSPAALAASGTWSTLKTAFARYYVDRYAKR